MATFSAQARKYIVQVRSRVGMKLLRSREQNESNQITLTIDVSCFRNDSFVLLNSLVEIRSPHWPVSKTGDSI